MNPTKLVFFKSFLLSLTLLSAAAPALGMENSSKNEIEKEEQEVEINNKPTFGKLIDGNLLNKSQVWAAVIAFKKQLPAMIVTAGENSSELPMEIVENILFHYLLDTTIDPKIRANVALEFLADPDYKFLHRALERLINESDLPITAKFARELGYPESIQDKFKLELDEGFSRHALTAFKELITKEASYTIEGSYWEEIIDLFTKNNISVSWNELFPRMKINHIIELPKHIFTLDPSQFDSKKIDYLVKLLICLLCTPFSKKIDWNFENDKGITPLIWLAKVPANQQSFNGHYDTTLRHLLDSLKNDLSLLDQKNKFGQSFRDLSTPETLKIITDHCNFIKKLKEKHNIK